jgi:putative ABC transport system substrate-binding protein
MPLDQLKRRQFITLLGGAAAAWPLAAHAQQPAMPVIGWLGAGTSQSSNDLVSAFRRGLGEAGYIEGINVVIEYRWAETQYDRLPALVADLVRRDVSVIATPDSIVTAKAAKAATSTIPIVFGIGADPIESGLVDRLNRPTGNLTGVTRLNSELEPKRLELLHELIPTAKTIALLVNPGNPGTDLLTKTAQEAARKLTIELQVVQASTDADIDAAFETMARMRVGGLVVAPDPLFVLRSEQLARRALSQAMPAMFQYRDFVVGGGLVSYAGNRTESYRLVGLYAGRILKGAKPTDLPIQQYSNLELIINLKTARALGITVPLGLLTRADEVIE